MDSSERSLEELLDKAKLLRSLLEALELSYQVLRSEIVSPNNDESRLRELNEREIEMVKELQTKRHQLFQIQKELQQRWPEEYKKHSHLFTLEESFSSFHKFLKEWEIPENEIEIDKTQKINEGSYGTVYKGNCRGSEVAVKELKSSNQRGLEVLKREALIMAKLHHENILLFMGICSKKTNPLLGSRKTSHTFIAEHISNQTEKLKIARDIALGMNWLARRNIVHLDLKPNNILISEHGEVKITDFGFSGFITELWDNIHCGTYNYAAPELLTKSMKPTEKTDVYSYGMCLWEIFTNPHKYPWQNEIPLQDKGEFIKRVVHERARPKLSEDLPQKLRKLIEECWDHDPEKRPSFEQIAKELYQIALESTIKNEDARNFWATHFPGKFDVAFDDFKARFDEKFRPTSSKIHEIVLPHLFQVQNKKDSVTLEKFGFAVNWLQPFEQSGYYFLLNLYQHGYPSFLSREEAEGILRNSSYEKCFLYRFTQNNPGHLIISAKHPQLPDFLHFQGSITGRKTFLFNDKEFQTIQDLNNEFRTYFQKLISGTKDIQIEISNALNPTTPPNKNPYARRIPQSIRSPQSTSEGTQQTNTTQSSEEDTPSSPETFDTDSQKK